MSALMLRPGAVVEPVEEGLLFSGWQDSTLMVCQPGVAKVWRAIEPAMRGGFEAEVLRDRLPEAARKVCDVLVATLRDNAMLVPAPAGWATEDRTQHYLAHSAADPRTAAERLAATVVGVRGRREQAAAVTLMLAESGIRLGGGRLGGGDPLAGGRPGSRWQGDAAADGQPGGRHAGGEPASGLPDLQPGGGASSGQPSGGPGSHWQGNAPAGGQLGGGAVSGQPGGNAVSALSGGGTASGQPSGGPGSHWQADAPAGGQLGGGAASEQPGTGPASGGLGGGPGSHQGNAPADGRLGGGAASALSGGGAVSTSRASITAEPWLVWIGAASEFAEATRDANLVVAAVAVGESILVAPCDAGPERLRAAVGRASVQGVPGALAWAVARSVLVECVHRLLAGTSRSDRAFLVDASGSLDVPLAPPLHAPSPMAFPAAEQRSRDDSAMLARLEPVTAEAIGPFPAPHPGTLVQHPLARQTVGGVHGAGLDQARAGADAVLCFLRETVSEQPNTLAVAGDGPADLLADAIGRLAVAESQEPEAAWTAQTPVARRWVQAVNRLAGQQPSVTTTRSRGVAVAKATTTDRASWGYGADEDTAAEHAVRGLLKALVADLPTKPRSVVVSHESTAALPLLAVAPAIAENRIHLLDLGGGLAETGILVGTVEGRP